MAICTEYIKEVRMETSRQESSYFVFFGYKLSEDADVFSWIILKMLPFYLAVDFGGLGNVKQSGCCVFLVCRYDFWLVVLNTRE